MCVNLTDAPVATAVRAAATGRVSMSTLQVYIGTYYRYIMIE